MTIYTNFIVFPEGEEQEINHNISINQLVDVNGLQVALPLKTTKIIVYRVSRKSTREKIGEVNTYFYLEQLSSRELIQYLG